MSGTYRLDGQLYPVNPISTVWVSPEIVGTSGNGVPIFSPVRQCELQFPIMEVAEWLWFQTKFEQGTLHDAVLPAPYDQILTQYTGVSILSLDQEKTDIREWVFDGAMVLANINLGATGAW